MDEGSRRAVRSRGGSDRAGRDLEPDAQPGPQGRDREPVRRPAPRQQGRLRHEPPPLRPDRGEVSVPSPSGGFPGLARPAGPRGRSLRAVPDRHPKAGRASRSVPRHGRREVGGEDAHPRGRDIMNALLLLLLALSPVEGAMATADDWPSWRGPNRDGVSAEKNLPATWSAESNVLWKAPLPGAAGSTPVVAKDRIFVASPGGDSLLLLCIGTDGKPQWERALAKGVKETKNLASASPTT